MTKIIKFENSKEGNLQRAEQLMTYGRPVLAAAIINRILKNDEFDEDALLKLAEIYNSILQIDFANQMFLYVIAKNKSVVAFKGLIENLCLIGKIELAKSYNQKYKINFDFNNFLIELCNSDDDDDQKYKINIDYNDFIRQLYNGDDDDSECNFAEFLSGIKNPDGNTEIPDNNDCSNSKNKRRSNLKLVVPKRFQHENKQVDEGSINKEISVIITKYLNSNNDAAINRKNDKLNARKVGFKQVYPMAAKEAQIIFDEGKQLFIEGQHLLALECFNKILNNKFYKSDVNKYKALCYLALGKYNLMRDEIEAGLKNTPNDFCLKCYKCIALKLLDEDALAEAAFNEIIKVNPSDISEIINKLDVCRILNYHKGVLDCSAQSLEVMPYSPIFLLLYAKALFNVGKKNKAIQILKAHRLLYPYSWDAYVVLENIKNEKYNVVDYGDMSVIVCRELAMKKFINDLSKVKLNDNNFLNCKNDKTNLRFILSAQNIDINDPKNLINILSPYFSEGLCEVYEAILLDNSLDFNIKTAVIRNMLMHKNISVIKIVYDDMYKECEVSNLKHYDDIPRIILEAYGLCFAKYLITEENFSKYINELKNVIDEIILRVDDLDEIKLEISRFRKVEIFCKILLEKVNARLHCSDDIDILPQQRAIYLKYKKVLFDLENK